MPFCEITLTAQKPPPKGYRTHPHTMGEYLRKRRIDLGLTPKEAAHRLGVQRKSYYIWENDLSPPPAWIWYRIMAFLGYYDEAQAKDNG